MADVRPPARDQDVDADLWALQEHPIFQIAAQRPLKREEVDVYLSVKAKIKAAVSEREAYFSGYG